jgi:hypothetical protein
MKRTKARFLIVNLKFEGSGQGSGSMPVRLWRRAVAAILLAVSGRILYWFLVLWALNSDMTDKVIIF